MINKKSLLIVGLLVFSCNQKIKSETEDMKIDVQAVITKYKKRITEDPPGLEELANKVEQKKTEILKPIKEAEEEGLPDLPDQETVETSVVKNEVLDPPSFMPTPEPEATPILVAENKETEPLPPTTELSTEKPASPSPISAPPPIEAHEPLPVLVTKSPKPEILAPKSRKKELVLILEEWFLTEDMDTPPSGRIFSVDRVGKISGVHYGTDLVAHLMVVREMARGYKQQPSPERLVLIERALRFYQREDKTDPKWWTNSIGKPQQLGRILIMLQEELNPDLLKDLTLKLSWIKDQPRFAKTAANLGWIGHVQLMRAVLEDNEEAIREVAAFYKESCMLTPQGEDGFKPDGTLHQHGPLIHNGSYGSQYIHALSEAAVMFRNTPLAFDDELLSLIADYVLSGARSTRGLRWDPSVVGREITRRLGSASRLRSTFQNLKISAKNPNLLKGVEDKLRIALHEEPSQTNTSTLRFSKYFWNSDYYVHHRPGFGVTVRTVSNRTLGTEAGNQENKHGFWLPFGTQFLTTNGRDYDQSIFAWNFNRLPGVTNPDRLVTFQQFSNRFETQKQLSSEVFGLSDGNLGLSAMRVTDIETTMQNGPDGKTARPQKNLIPVQYQKAWFFTEHGVVTLLNELHSTDRAKVHSTLEQIATDKTPTLGSKPVTLGAPSLTGKIGQSAQIGARVFIPLDNSVLTASYVVQTQSLSKIGHVPDSGDQVFTVPMSWVRINHGLRPKGAKAAYFSGILTPPQTLESLKASVTVTANSKEVSAIFIPSNSVSLSAFWAAGSLKTPAYTITVSKPCALYVRPLGKSYRLAVSSYSQGEIEVSISNQTETRTKVILLPDEDLTGKSVFRSDM